MMQTSWTLPFALVAASAATQDAPSVSRLLGSFEPSGRVSGIVVEDTDGQGPREVVLLWVDGRVQRYRLRSGASLALDGEVRLRDPGHTLLACRDVLQDPGCELVALDPSGAFVLPWPETEGEVAAPRALARRARCSLQLFAPQWSPFVVDLDGDSLLDLMVPSLQGCQPFLQTRTAGEAPVFTAMEALALPVRIDVDRGGTTATEDRQGSLVVPRVETIDLNGDGKKDLVTAVGQRHAFRLQQEGGRFERPIEVDLSQFVDSTEKAAVAPGSTIVLGDQQMLERGDIDGDGIVDFVVAHRRKIWTFVSSTSGPQFEKARTQAVADDVSAMLVLDLDDDARADLLTFQVQLPSIGSLLLGLVQSIDIDVRAVGYRSEANGFASLPAWRRTVTLRIPSLLSLLSRQEELVQRFLDILDKARPLVRGAFSAAEVSELAMVTPDGTALERYSSRSGVRDLSSASGRRVLRRLLFEEENPVFDLERIFAVLAGLLDERQNRLRGDAVAEVTTALRDPSVWRVQRLIAADLDGIPGDEIVVVYEGNDDPLRACYDVISLR